MYPFVLNNVQKLDFARVFLEEIKNKILSCFCLMKKT